MTTPPARRRGRGPPPGRPAPRPRRAAPPPGRPAPRPRRAAPPPGRPAPRPRPRRRGPAHPPLRCPTMETRTLGKAGPALSVVGLGCNNFGMRIDAGRRRRRRARRPRRRRSPTSTPPRCTAAGKSEEFLGAALGARARRGRDRHQVPAPARRTRRTRRARCAERIIERLRDSACAGSAPTASTSTTSTTRRRAPVDEALEALDELVEAGKVLHIASSNVAPTRSPPRPQIAEDRDCAALHRHPDRVEPARTATSRPTSSPPPRPPDRRRAVLPAGLRAAHRQVPAGRGLPGRAPGFAASVLLRRRRHRRELRPGRGLRAFAAERGRSVSSWPSPGSLAQPRGVGHRRGHHAGQVAANAAAATWVLSAAEAAAVAAL